MPGVVELRVEVIVHQTSIFNRIRQQLLFCSKSAHYFIDEFYDPKFSNSTVELALQYRKSSCLATTAHT